MMYLTLIFVLIIACIDNLAKNKLHIGVITILLFLVAVMGGATQIPDIDIYLLMYEDVYVSPDYLYALINDLFSFLGVSFEIYRVVYFFIGVLLIHATVKKFVQRKYYIVFYALYFIYPMALDIIQVRNFMAMSIFIFAFPLLLETSKSSAMKYVALIVIAMGFQITATVYLPMIFFRSALAPQRPIFYIVVYCIICFFIMQKGIVIGGMSLIVERLGVIDGRILSYMEVKANLGPYFILVLNLICLCACMLMLYSKRIDAYNDIQIDISITPFINMTTLSVLYVLLFVPLVMFEITFMRIFRNLIPLVYIAFLAWQPLVSNKLRLLVSLFIVLLITGLSFVDMGNAEFSYLLIPVLNNNWILPWGL